jgi:hypothetical protein
MVGKTGEAKSSETRAAASITCGDTRSDRYTVMGLKASQHATPPQQHTSFA